MNNIVALRISQSALSAQPTLQEIKKSFLHHLYVARTAEGKVGRARLRAGRDLLALRQRIEAGDPDARGLTWWEYYEQHLKAHMRSRKDAEKIMRLAVSDDPEAAEEDARRRTADAVRRHRAKKTAPAYVSGDLKELIERACELVAQMSDEARREFFAIMKERYEYA